MIGLRADIRKSSRKKELQIMAETWTGDSQIWNGRVWYNGRRYDPEYISRGRDIVTFRVPEHRVPIIRPMSFVFEDEIMNPYLETITIPEHRKYVTASELAGLKSVVFNSVSYEIIPIAAQPEKNYIHNEY